MSDIIQINDLNIPELDIYTKLNEVQLLHYFEPDKKGFFIAESAKVIGRALDSGCMPYSMLVDERELEGGAKDLLARCPRIPVYTASSSVLTKLTGYHLTRGILCAMYRPALPTISELCKNARRIVVLENIENPTNIGAIFRSAAALGMDAILLTPACSNPLYRRASRVSMGTVFQIPWTYIGESRDHWPTKGMAQLHDMGFKTLSMALKEDSLAIDEPLLLQEEKLAIILGNEGDGLSADTLAACDYTVKIPMFHGVDSLNVAAASAIAFWQFGKQLS